MITYEDLPFDVIHHICAVAYGMSVNMDHAMSLVNQHTRTACIPILFRELIYTRGYDERMIPWEEFEEGVELLLKNKSILRAVKSFHFRLWVNFPENYPIPEAFFRLLYSLPNLSDLAIIPNPEYLPRFKSEFDVVKGNPSQSSPNVLPEIRHLTIHSPDWLFLGDCTPSLTSLDIELVAMGFHPHMGLTIDVYRLGKSHPNLTSLHCDEIARPHVIEEIAANLPQLRSLGLYANPYGDRYEDFHYLNAYKQFSYLESLSLPAPGEVVMRSVPYEMAHPNIQKQIRQERRDAVGRLINGINTQLLGYKGCTLKEVIIGSRISFAQSVWENGNDGKLHESKIIHRSWHTWKIRAVEDVNQSE